VAAHRGEERWLRAADYYRSAEFWLLPDDPRRLKTFDKCERASHRWLKYLGGEVVEIPYEKGVSLPAYFVKPKSVSQCPVLISFGGLDSFKDELWFMTGRGAVQRGIAGRRAGAGRDVAPAQGPDALRLRGARRKMY
jgi:hypothetical protein